MAREETEHFFQSFHEYFTIFRHDYMGIYLIKRNFIGKTADIKLHLKLSVMWNFFP